MTMQLGLVWSGEYGLSNNSKDPPTEEDDPRGIRESSWLVRSVSLSSLACKTPSASMEAMRPDKDIAWPFQAKGLIQVTCGR